MFHPAYLKFVADRFRAWPEDPARTFTHAVLGLRTEWDEFINADSRENEKEEVGDFLFYCAALYPLAEMGPEWEPTPDEVEQADETLFFQGLEALTDMAKKWLAYSKQPTPLEIRNHLIPVMTYIAWRQDADLPSTIEANQAKLLKRYPNGFTTAAAIARADKEPGQ
jgi:hypothetical protein